MHLILPNPWSSDKGQPKSATNAALRREVDRLSISMQFIKNGPDVPERLVQAHEDGKVVFFCGAGISYPAGLPGFSGLVEKIYFKLGEDFDPLEKVAFRRQQYDTVIGLLERRVVGRRDTIRGNLPEILSPDLSATGATATHQALLTLARNREGPLRLVTTNFDRIFQTVIERESISVSTFEAPLLPIPKRRWDGIVYLHGILPCEENKGNLDDLVLSSGDFGLAYLTEAWAARFVAELFRNFTICFIGYSINDPVLRYMTDALAADKVLGESPSEMFAFGSFSKNKPLEQQDEWEAKNVTPILYREHKRHYYLHKSLRVWSEMYRDGIQGKEQVVVSFAGADPLVSTEQDDFIGRMMWALSDPSGNPAKRFAENDPVPSLNWLSFLCKEGFQNGILGLDGAQSTDRVMNNLMDWLIRHLNDPKLVLWIAKKGGHLHSRFNRKIETKLEHLAQLEHDGKYQELKSIRRVAPNAVPSPFMRILWKLILSGRLKSAGETLRLFRGSDSFKLDGLTLPLKIELRDILAPRIAIRKRIPPPVEQGETGESQSLENLVDWEVVLGADHLLATLSKLTDDENWKNVLPDLLPDFSLLLQDALDLQRELSGVEHKRVMSIVEQPSISDHPQNESFFDWTVLIDLTRDAWLEMARLDPTRARSIAEGWVKALYPLFKRLAFFAASEEEVIPVDQALCWLLHDENRWLWSIETKREAIRLIVKLAPRLHAAAMSKLERAILKGPPAESDRSGVGEDLRVRLSDHNVWLRLARAEETGAVLGEATQNKLNELSQRYPQWQLAADERDEFAIWTSSSDDARDFIATPQGQAELVVWLRQHPSSDAWNVDDWQKRCREDFTTASSALIALAEDGEYLKERWATALLAWSDAENLKLSWCRLAKFFAEEPDEFIFAVSHELILWLMEQARQLEGQEEHFFVLIGRFLEMEHQDPVRSDGDLVSQALNHPIGRVTEALMRWWYSRSPQHGEGLPSVLQSFLDLLCNSGVERYRNGRVVLAIHLHSLYQVDEEWTTHNLLPSFDWRLSEAEALAMWQGFLLSPRLTWPLMEALKQSFLDSAGHFSSLGRYGENYASLLTFVALDQGEVFKSSELKSATRTLPSDGLGYVANSLVRALSGAGDQRVEYWKNRIVPYLDSIWPKSIDTVSPGILESFALLCINSEDAFPEATRKLETWLQHPVEDPYRTHRANRIIHDLADANLSSQFPDEALMLLDSLKLSSDEAWLPSDRLSECLSAIQSSSPSLETDSRFQTLQSSCQNS